ncbi:MAG TPA: class I SAM-dependent methyltransferase [Bryobacteraceae bacterium]|nr:class I SAM-dependent methyltransferase [Bryobacteraceae bacterium]
MTNPWLSIPLADYEGHMGSDDIRQLAALADLFGEALEIRRPESVAVLGIAGGNGLDRIDTAVTHRVLGIDCNSSYLEAVRQRYAAIPGLELHCLDLAEQPLQLQRVELVHAALVFEHAGLGRCLDNALALIAPGGALSVVLQLPSETEAGVTPSRFVSIQNLKSHFSLIDEPSFRAGMEKRSYTLRYETRCSLPGGKSFWMGIFQPPEALNTE